MKKLTADQKEAHSTLRKMIKPGDTVYTIAKHVSKSGMSRVISCYIPVKTKRTRYDAKGNPKVVSETVIQCIDYWIKQACGYTIDQNHFGLKVNGCGMDMGFAVVYDLGRTLWPNGTKKPHGTRNGSPDMDGGYAINHRWM